MSSQRVFRLPQRTSIRDITLVNEPIPTPLAHEVLVKVKSVALNFRDFAVATGQYPFPVKDNVVPCSDMAGDVVSVGDQVADFAKGDKVIAAFDPPTLYGPIKNKDTGLGGPVDGVLKEYVSLPASALVKVPAETKLSYPQLASLVCTGVTAWNCLYGNIPLKPGQTVLFLGTGGVSISGLILAKAAGATTIVTSSSESKLEQVQKTYGADYTINYKTHPKWSEEVLRITNGKGADFIIENGGAGTIAESLASVAYGGNVSAVGFLAPCPQDKMPDVAMLALGKGAVVRGIVVGSRQQLEDVTNFVSSKNLNVPVEKVFGFEKDEVVAAVEYLISGQHVGKVCISMN